MCSNCSPALPTASGGVGRSANQYFNPQLERDGSLDVAFMQEDSFDASRLPRI